MKLSGISSLSLLPRFSRGVLARAVAIAFDDFCQKIDRRCRALPCEASDAALLHSRDDELATLAGDLGVVPYYPDLERRVRERLIKEASLWTRKAATPAAAAALVNTIFSTDSTSVLEADEGPQDYVYTMVIDGDIVTSNLGFKRLTECLRYVGHATTTPILVEVLNADTPDAVYTDSSPVIFQYEVTV